MVSGMMKLKDFFIQGQSEDMGPVGSRMDEPGPYLDSLSRHQDKGPSPDICGEENWERRVQGPEKPSFWDVSLLMVISARILWMECHQAPQTKNENKSKLV